MNDLHLNETTLDLFEDYSKNQLNGGESAEFKNKLDQDDAFRSLYETFLTSKAVINEKIEAGLRDQLKQWGATNGESPAGKIIDMPNSTSMFKRTNWTRWVAAASALLVLGFGIKQYYSITSYPEKLIEEQIPLDVVSTRSDESAMNRVNKIIAPLLNHPGYSREELTRVITELIPIDPKDTVDYTPAQYWIGLLQIRLGNCEKGTEAFKNAGKKEEFMQWTKLLCLVKTKNTGIEYDQIMKDLLKNPDGQYFDKANEIQKKTSTIWWNLFK